MRRPLRHLFTAAVLRVAAWAAPLAVAVVFVCLSRPVTLYRSGLPSKDELYAYVNAHRGAYPPLPNPKRATYLIVDPRGLSWFRQVADVPGPNDHDRNYGGPTYFVFEYAD